MTINNDVEVVPINKLWLAGEKEVLALKLATTLQQPGVVKQRSELELLQAVTAHTFKESDIRVGLYRAYDQYRLKELGTYVVYAANELKGLAIVDPDPYLRQHRFALPIPALTSRMIKQVQVPGPKVSAWMIPNQDEMSRQYLAETYQTLADPDGLAADFYQEFAENQPPLTDDGRPLAHTVEPMNSADWIHKSIRQAGFVEADRGYYDDRTNRLAMPTMSRYSIAPQG